MTSRLSLIFGVLFVALLTLSGCTGATPTLDPTATNLPDPTSPPTETPSPTVESPTPLPTAIPTPTPTPQPTWIPLPTLDFDYDITTIQGMDDLPVNALARFGMSSERINSVLFPDSSGIILWSASGIYAYSLPDLELLWRQYLDPIPYEITFSEDGKLVNTYRILVDGCETEITVFDAETGQLLEQYFPDDGIHAEESGSIRVVQREAEEVDDVLRAMIDVYEDDEYVGRLEMPGTLSYADEYFPLFISPGEDYIVAVDRDGVFYVWGYPSFELLYSKRFSSGDRSSSYAPRLSFSVDGKYIAYFDGARLLVALAETGEELYRSEARPLNYDWLPQSLLLSGDKTFRFVSIDGWETYFEEEGKPFALSHDDELIALGDQHSVSILDVESLELEYSIPLSLQNSDYHIGWSDDDKWLTVTEGWSPYRATLIDLEAGEPAFAQCRFPDGSRFIAGGRVYFILNDGRLLVVDLTQGEVTNGMVYAIMPQSLEWAVDEDALIIEGELGTWLWSEGINELHMVESPPDGHPGIEPAWSLITGPGDRHPSPDGQISVVIVNEGGCGDGPCCCGCGYESSVLQFFEGDSDQPFAEYPFEPGISALAWSPDGSLLALGHQGFGGFFHEALWADRISIIDPDTGQVLQTLTGHSGGITGLLFSPDGSRLVSTSEDGTIIIWAIGDQ